MAESVDETDPVDLPDREDRTDVIDLPVARPAVRRQSRGYLIVLSGNHVGEMFHVDGQLSVGRDPESDIILMDRGISRAHCQLDRTPSGKVTIADLESTNGTYANGERIADRVLAEGDRIQLGSEAILKFTYHDEVEVQFQRQMYDSAVRDGLTGAFNKRFFLDRYAAEFAFALRHSTPLTICMLDLDHFKQLNDRHGHLAGDYALRKVSDAIRATIRTEDVLCRYGGEEFVVLSRGISVQNAAIMGERIRLRVDGLSLRWKEAELAVSISVGVAGLPDLPCEQMEELIAAADGALYRAKDEGRNRVRVHKP